MRELEKYYKFVSLKQLFLKRAKENWFQFFRIGSFVRVLFYSDGYFNLKFSGICVRKSFCGVGSSFVLKNRLGLTYKYFFFMPTIVRMVLIRFLKIIISKKGGILYIKKVWRNVRRV